MHIPAAASCEPRAASLDQKDFGLARSPKLGAGLTEHLAENDYPAENAPQLLNHPLVKQNLPLALHYGFLSTESSNLHLISF
jgi:hypothetical protein